MINDNSIQREPTVLLGTMLSAAKLQIWWSNVGHDIARVDMKPRVFCLNYIKCNIFRLRNANISDLVISGYIHLVKILYKNAEQTSSSRKLVFTNTLEIFPPETTCLDFANRWKMCGQNLNVGKNKNHLSLQRFVKPIDNLPLNWTIALRCQWYAGVSR